jgi:hypothetical protein
MIAVLKRSIHIHHQRALILDRENTVQKHGQLDRTCIRHHTPVAPADRLAPNTSQNNHSLLSVAWEIQPDVELTVMALSQNSLHALS